MRSFIEGLALQVKNKNVKHGKSASKIKKQETEKQWN